MIAILILTTFLIAVTTTIGSILLLSSTLLSGIIEQLADDYLPYVPEERSKIFWILTVVFILTTIFGIFAAYVYYHGFVQLFNITFN
jgi:hypothetical protein